ncbi:MAG: ATP-dependent Clp protease ATP-binding subunit, partial [Clostridia bacterium]|nr:ATP-dependent Clp protease ATP-binding subunit [Clostridia bacterium]
MVLKLCSRCKKRVAVIYMQRIDNGNTVNEGLCLKCAREMGLKPVDDILERMGITPEEFDAMSDEISGLVPTEGNDTEESEGRAPSLNLGPIFPSQEGLNLPDEVRKDKQQGKEQKGDNKKEKNRKFLSQYCIDLTGRAKEGKLDKVIGRNEELERVMQILCRRQKNNPCLIGEPGVGKTAVAEALAARIVAGTVPYKLKGKEVMLVDMTAMVAGTQFRGQFESRMKGLIDEVKQNGNIILVIDEVHSIV